MAETKHEFKRQVKLRFYESLLYIQKFYQIPQRLQLIIFALGFYQYIACLQLPVKTDSYTLLQTSFNYQYLFIYLSRIDIVITIQFDLIEKQYLFALGFLLFFYVLPLTLALQIKKKNIFMQNTFLHTLMCISSFFLQIFSHFFYLPLLYLIIHSISHMIYEGNVDIIHLFFALITLLVCFLVQIMYQLIILKSFDYKFNSFQQTSSSFLDLVFQLFLIIQVLTFTLIESLKYAIIIQSIIIILISIIKIIRLFEQYICHRFEIQIAIFVSSFGLVGSCSTLFFQLIDGYQRCNNSVTLLTFLIIYSTLYKYFQKYETQILLQIVPEQKKKQIKMFFAKIINKQLDYSQFHLIQCLVFRYYCKKNGNLELFSKINLIDSLDENIMNKFFTKKLKILSKYLIAEKNFDKDYISILYQLKFHNLAYKQIMIALNQYLLKRLDQQDQSYQSESVQKFKQLHQRQMQSVSTLRQSSKSNSQEINNAEKKFKKRRHKLLLPVRNKITLLDEAQLKYLRQDIRNELNIKYQGASNFKQRSNEIQQVIQIYLHNEKKNSRFRDEIMNLLMEKIQFFQQFTNKKVIDHSKLFNQAKRLSCKLYEMEQKLIRRYEQYPSHKVQSILIYLQSELLNNLVEAYRLKNLTSISDQQLIDLDQNLQIQLFSNDVVYINVAQFENEGDIQIINHSQNMQAFFEMNDQHFKEFTNIQYILPDFIASEHSILVSQFIQTGNSKFYLQYSPSFYKSVNNLVKQCELLFDLHYDDKYLFKFSLFLRNAGSMSSFLFLDVNEQIGGITDTLFDKLKYSYQFVELIKLIDFKLIQINQILPDFQHISQERKQNVRTQFQFIKQEIFINQFQQAERKTSFSQLWNDKSNLNLYSADLIIQYQQIFEFCYYIIEIREIQLKNEDQFVQSQETEHFADVEKHFELSQLTESEAQANEAKDFQQKNYERYLEEKGLKKKCLEQQHDNFSNISQQLLQLNNQIFEQNILSPNASQQLLSRNLADKIKSQQQDYFNQSMQDISYSLQKSAKMQLFQEFEILEQEEKVQKRQYFDQNIKNDSTLTSKQTGLQKSLFYKKYELVQDTISQHFPSSGNKLIVLNLLSLFSSFIFYIIVLVLVSQDLNRFIAEIDMIQLHSGVMVPHDFYFQMRFSIFTYTGFLNKQVITKERFTNLTDPLYENMNIGYYGFKNGFMDQLNNEYLQPFYNDQNITVYFMQIFGTTTYPVTYSIREVFFTYLTYYYDFLLRFNARLSPANQTYQVFQFANVYGVHFILEDLAQNAWAYSKNRSYMVKDKWNEIWIIFLILSFLFTTLSLYYLKIFRQLYDKYLNLFRYCTSSKVQREIDKCKFQIKVLKNRAEYLYYYKLDVDQLEEYILNEKVVLDKEQEKFKSIKYTLQLKQLQIVTYVLLITGVWIVFFLFSFFSNQQIQAYLDKYPDSCDLYKQLQNMSLSTGAMPRNREFKLTFPSLPYLRQQDSDQFYQTMAYSQDDIAAFMHLCLNFNPDLYYASSSFLDYFENIQHTDICSLLTPSELGFLDKYCDLSFNGNLRLGLSSAIKYLSNQIKLEQDVNNFTKRIDYRFYEMEGGLIIMRAYEKMSREFKLGMITVTQEQININNALSICYIIFNIIMIVYFLIILPKYLQKELIYTQRFIQLVPKTVLMLDDQFERHARIIQANEKY